LTFTGRKFGVLALLDPSSGRMTVLVDGAVVATVDLYAKRAQTQTVSIRTVTTGTHTVTLAWTGTKSAASSGTTIKIDGIAVIAS
jgi:alpha-amylase